MAQNGTDWKPSKVQKKVVHLMLEIDKRRPIKDLVEEAGVPRRTFYNWMADPKFKAYLQKQTDLYTDMEVPEAWKSLIRNVRRGDTPAIKLFMELKGKYTPKVDVGNKDDKPFKVESGPDLSKLTVEEKKALLELVKKANGDEDTD